MWFFTIYKCFHFQNRNPNGASRAHQVGWPKYDAKSTSSKHILRIGPYKMLDNTEIITSIIHEDRAEKCAFWNDLFPKLKALQKKSIDDKCPPFSTTAKNEAGENDTNFLPVFYPKKLRKNSKEDFTKLTTTNVQNEDDNKIQTSTTTEIQKSSTTENPNNKIVSKTNNHLQLSKVQSTMEKQTNVRKNTKKPKDEIEKVETNLPPIINSLKKASPLVSNTKPTKQIIFLLYV